MSPLDDDDELSALGGGDSDGGCRQSYNLGVARASELCVDALVVFHCQVGVLGNVKGHSKICVCGVEAAAGVAQDDFRASFRDGRMVR